MTGLAPIVVVGAGHNGLVAACYLAQAGRDVVVLERLDRPGGGSRTEEVIPGHRFDLHSVAHNIINMTAIPDELDLVAAGLHYIEMDPFSIAVHEDGRRVRFHRSIEETVDSIAETSPLEAEAYDRFIESAMPIVKAMMPAIRGEMPLSQVPGRLVNLVQALRHGPLGVVRDVLGPYDALLSRRLTSDLTRGPVAAFAAHAGVGPTAPGSALFAFWQAAYHLHGQWHGRGGSQNLTDALVTRLAELGGQLRCSAGVERIETTNGRVSAVVLEGGERIAASTIVTALDVKTALLDLVDPPLAPTVRADLAAARRSNVVQAVVHLATDALPSYENSKPGDWNGLQSYVDRLDDLTGAWTVAEAGRFPDPTPLYTFTPSAIDPTLAPPGRHTVYAACPAAPATIDGGWDGSRQRLIDVCIATIEARAPGFASSVSDAVAWTPDDMVSQEGWPGAHPMHLDIGLDQLGPFRPTRSLGNWRTPIQGLYISGAGTNPTGGIAGTPGRQAAKAVLADSS